MPLSIPMITIDLWLYGPLAQYGGEANEGSHSHLALPLPAGSTMQDLVQNIELPLDEKGITFINRQLSDMPGLAADMERVLAEGDRVAIFHTKSMWPYQYRDNADATPELKKAMQMRDGGGLHHRYNE